MTIISQSNRQLISNIYSNCLVRTVIGYDNSPGNFITKFRILIGYQFDNFQISNVSNSGSLVCTVGSVTRSVTGYVCNVNNSLVGNVCNSGNH